MLKYASIILIHTCSIPRYSCGGHVALAIFDADKTWLTELHVRHDINNLRPSCCEYHIRLVFTNTLTIKIEMEDGEEARSRIREIYINSLKMGSYCEKWSIPSNKVGALLEMIIQKKEKINEEKHRFCMMGKKNGSFFGISGYNCVDYAKSILEGIGISDPGQPMNLSVLENYVSNLQTLIPPKPLKMN